MAARHSYLFHTLKHLSESPKPQTVEQILDYLATVRGFLKRYESFELGGPQEPAEMEDVLLKLAEIGVLRAEGGRDEGILWTLAAPPIDGAGDRRAGNDRNADGPGGGGGGGGGGGPGGDTPDGQGGVGLSEVLAHPVLFCLSEDVQERLLMQALGLPPEAGAQFNGRAA